MLIQTTIAISSRMNNATSPATMPSEHSPASTTPMSPARASTGRRSLATPPVSTIDRLMSGLGERRVDSRAASRTPLREPRYFFLEPLMPRTIWPVNFLPAFDASHWSFL